MEELKLYEGRPADCTGRLEKEIRTYDLLDKLGIQFWRTDHGWMKADTMEELAAKLNLPVEATVATWERYNKFAEQGKDEDYNKEPYRLTSLTHPPYYGVRTGAWFLATIDGCPINTDMHPVNEAGEQIDGLYLVGNDSGGFFSVSYPNLMTGLAAGRTMTFGRRAGMLAATGQA